MSNEETQSRHSQNGRPLRRILSSAFTLMETRLELLGIELAEEKQRLIAVLFLGLAAMMLGMLALVSFTALIAIAFWDTYRWQALAGVTIVYVVAALVCALRARSGLHGTPLIFEGLLKEFEKDREAFRKP